MFSYYEQAEICYAYLEDVDKQHPLAESQWFTRGWTLPELIAPKVVEFLDLSWNRLGTRESLASQITTITSIPTPVLRGHSIKNYNAACRMSWAAGRSTSMEVDMSNCLLGLFDVKTSLDFTEGIAAFRRLQQLILEKHQDYTLLAWDRTGSSPIELRHILAPSADYFHSARNAWSYRDMQKSLTRNGKLSLLASRFIIGIPGGCPQVTPDGIVLTLPIRQFHHGSFQVCLTTCSRPQYNFVCLNLAKLAPEESRTMVSGKPRINEYWRTGNVEFIPMVSPFQGPKFEYEKIFVRWFYGDENNTHLEIAPDHNNVTISGNLRSHMVSDPAQQREDKGSVVAASERLKIDAKAPGRLCDVEEEEGGAAEETLAVRSTTERSGPERPGALKIPNQQDELNQVIKHFVPTIPSIASNRGPTTPVKRRNEHFTNGTDIDAHDDKTKEVQQVPTDSGYATGSYGQSNQLHGQGDPHETPNEDSDNRTIFSGTDRGDQGYVSELADAIFQAVKLSQFDTRKMERISEMLPGLLRAFSLRLGSEPSDPMQAEAAYWIRKYRQ